jgi:hypothetical protein
MWWRLGRSASTFGAPALRLGLWLLWAQWAWRWAGRVQPLGWSDLAHAWHTQTHSGFLLAL